MYAGYPAACLIYLSGSAGARAACAAEATRLCAGAVLPPRARGPGMVACAVEVGVGGGCGFVWGGGAVPAGCRIQRMRVRSSRACGTAGGERAEVSSGHGGAGNGLRRAAGEQARMSDS